MLGLAVGAALVAALATTIDLRRVVAALAGVGWGMAPVVAAHLPQTLFATLGWRALIPAAGPGLGRLFVIRWVKEAVNSLLPVGQVGGDLVRARLLAREGVGLATAAASAAVDVALGTLALFAYLAVGAALLYASGAAPNAAAGIGAGVAAAAFVVLAAMMAPRLGLLRLIDRLPLMRADGGGMDEAVARLYGQRGRLVVCAGHHLLAWGLGAVETFAALSALGLHPSLFEALLIDSLGAAARAVGFAVPAAVGFQEGGFVLAGALFGLAPAEALALSLLKRGRELILGAPGLLAWGLLERRGRLAEA